MTTDESTPTTDGSSTTHAESFQFQTEITQLLQLIIHSLYFCFCS
jgi:hypothetical protein